MAEPPLQLGSNGRLLTADVGDGLTGQIVGRGTETSCRDDQVRGLQRVAQRGRDRAQPVRQGRDPGHVHAGLGQRAGQVAAVGVARLARGQLAADREQNGREECSCGDGRDFHVASVRAGCQSPPSVRPVVRPRVLPLAVAALVAVMIALLYYTYPKEVPWLIGPPRSARQRTRIPLLGLLTSPIPIQRRAWASSSAAPGTPSWA